MQDTKLRHQLVRLLMKTLIFAEAPEQFRSEIVERVVPAEFPPGKALFRHGEPGSWMGIVVYGRIERKLQREHQEILIGDVGPGGIIGDLGVFGISFRRSFTVTALTHSAVLVLSREKFEEAINIGGSPYSLGLFRDGTQMANLMADTESFLNLKCFKGLDVEFIMALRENSEPRLCYQNQVLMKEGAYGDEMYILRAGTVKILKGGKCIVELPAGVVLGELAVLGTDKRRTASVVCSSLCFIRALHADVFKEILDRFPAAKRTFDHAYVAKLASLDVTGTKSEMENLNRINGAPTPKSTQEMQKLFGAQLSFAEKARRLDSSKTGLLALPPLTPKTASKARVRGEI